MKIALIGYGKMGKTIEQIIHEQQNEADEIVLKIGENNLNDFTVENLRKADVAIEFTQPEAAIANIYKCFEAGVPVVVGTTAWLNQLDEVTRVCQEKNGTLFYAPNFSIGVNIFFEVNRHLATLMNRQPQYEVSMEEIHHTEKKDAPSGTAIKAAEVMLTELKRYNAWKLDVADSTTAFPIIAKREPEVPGTHTVTYKCGVDELVFTHQAHSRKGFAEGAVAAARWVIGKKGVYQMKDMLAL